VVHRFDEEMGNVSVSHFVQRLALVSLLAMGLACLGVIAGVGGLESKLSRASDNVGLLPPTRLTALPHKVIVNGTSPLRVRFSGVPASFSPTPELSPATPGTWTRRGDSELFTPALALDPCSTYTLTIWASSVAARHSPLGKRRTVPFQVACPSTRGLQQTLARLDYLPYEAGHSPSGDPLNHAQLSVRDAFDPPAAQPRARFADAPPLEYGQLDETTKGALMVFQSEHEIEPTGTPESATWKALFHAAVEDQRAQAPYTFVTVTESLPETLEVHREDHVVLSTPANTGVPGAETAQGIFPIFSRFVSTTMTGTDPDGTKYVAPDVPWVNYFNGGDAVHGYPRASYGFPQSNGCVELPIETAHAVFEMLKIGDMVEVS
jgi:peptidoglycan hydrolase-like protein with peptidoglycan-binding domain